MTKARQGSKPRGAKPGKKVGQLHVQLDRNDLQVELRLSLPGGTFHAEYEGRWYDALTQGELADQIRQVADAAWTRYLVIGYTAKACHLDGDRGRPLGAYQVLSIEADRDALAEVGPPEEGAVSVRALTSIELNWSIYEFSTPYALPGNPSKTVRMRREVERQLTDRSDGSGSAPEGEIYQDDIAPPDEQEDDRLPPGAVPWTAEREALLRDLLATLGQIDAQMVALFHGDPEQVARQLDEAAQRGASRALVLPAPPASTDRNTAYEVERIHRNVWRQEGSYETHEAHGHDLARALGIARDTDWVAMIGRVEHLRHNAPDPLPARVPFLKTRED